MTRLLVTAAVAAVIALGGVAGAQETQQCEQQPMGAHHRQGQAAQSGQAADMMQGGMKHGVMQKGGKMDCGMAKGGMMQSGMMQGGAMGMHGMSDHMLRFMMALVDSDANGTLSLEEVLEMHRRLFVYADSDGDGQLTLEEIKAFTGDGMPGH